MWIKSTSFNVWVTYFVWNFKGTLWNSTQNILPIHWKVWFLYNIEILRALRFKSSQVFLKRPPGLSTQVVNTLKMRQNGCHCADNIFKCTFLHENWCLLIKILPNFAANGPINNIPSLVQIMAWCWTGTKPLSKPMMYKFTDTYMYHWASMC